MRNGQNNKRMRGRNRKGGHHHHQNPLSRMYESNGPDVKIRGTASHVAEKYLQLARDSQSSGDPIAAENYYQHAEHYFRLIAAAQEQLRQTQPSYYQQSGEVRGNNGEDTFDDGEGEQPGMAGEPFAPQPQPFYPQQQPPQTQPQQNFQPRQQNYPPQNFQKPNNFQQPSNFQQSNDEDVERLPSFITGGQQQPQPPQQPQQAQGSNGYDGSPDRFPLHRRRRRHRSGPRDQSMPSDSDGPGPADTSND